MKDGTALQKASHLPLPAYAHDAMRYNRHPQDRTYAFHLFYNSPVHRAKPTRDFSYMSDERVAFRAAFIISEALELVEKGLGIKLSINIEDDFHEGEAIFMDPDKETFCATLAQSIRNANKRDLVEVADALGDLNVVVNGFALELGLDMHVVDAEVCASNFTKADENGKPIIGDGKNGPVGKVLKGPNYMEPQLAIALGLGE